MIKRFFENLWGVIFTIGAFLAISYLFSLVYYPLRLWAIGTKTNDVIISKNEITVNGWRTTYSYYEITGKKATYELGMFQGNGYHEGDTIEVMVNPKLPRGVLLEKFLPIPVSVFYNYSSSLVGALLSVVFLLAITGCICFFIAYATKNIITETKKNNHELTQVGRVIYFIKAFFPFISYMCFAYILISVIAKGIVAVEMNEILAGMLVFVCTYLFILIPSSLTIFVEYLKRGENIYVKNSKQIVALAFAIYGTFQLVRMSITRDFTEFDSIGKFFKELLKTLAGS